jgi:hypothetical protein
MWVIFAVTITGLVLTSDNEPPAPMKVEKEERTHSVKGGVPNNDGQTITVIKNPLR